jgi:hypothetical protein
MTTGRRLLGLLVLITAVVATLGHICVLPGHASEAHDAAGRSDDHHRHDVPGDADASHVASCDALGTPTSAPPSVLAVSTLRSDVVDVTRHIEARLVDVPTPSGSPPLYLIHAALLI